MMRWSNNPHPILSYGTDRILLLEKKMAHGVIDRQGFSDLIDFYSEMVQYYDSIDDPMVDYYIKKSKLVMSNQTCLDVMNNLQRGMREGKKTGYKYGNPISPFGKLLKDMNIKLKGNQRRSKFEELRRNLLLETPAFELKGILDNRIDTFSRILVDILSQEESITHRLVSRKKQ